MRLTIYVYIHDIYIPNNIKMKSKLSLSEFRINYSNNKVQWRDKRIKKTFNCKKKKKMKVYCHHYISESYDYE